MRDYQEIAALIDRDPGEAIRLARIHLGGDSKSDLQRAGILIDAGSVSGADARDAVEEGIALCRGLLAAHPSADAIRYNLANGLTELARLDQFGPDWHLSTAGVRREARIGFAQSSACDDAGLRSRSYTNLGNILLSSYRWVEAFDCYVDAVNADSSNGIALTGILKALHHGVTQAGLGDTSLLRGVVAHYAGLAAKTESASIAFGGKRGWEAVQPLIKAFHGNEPKEQQRPTPVQRVWNTMHLLVDVFNGKKLKTQRGPTTEYEAFAIRERLALSPTIAGTDTSLERWDSLTIVSFTESIETERGVPPVFAMLNVIRADYLSARWLAYTAMREAESIPETGSYADTLDYATYGTRVSAVCTAQRCTLDVLDKIAVATLHILGASNAKKAHFKSFWLQKDGKTWRTEVDVERKKGNHAILALTELANDLNKEGFLHTKSMLRNTSTHRFTVLHDMGLTGVRECDCVEHHVLRDFERHLLETMRLAKAACLYFVELIAQRERRDKSGVVVPLFVPDHHDIRGEP